LNYFYNGDSGVYVGNGYCSILKDFKDPRDGCESFHCFRADDVTDAQRIERRIRKMSLFNIRLFQDRDQWCALIGDTIEEGTVAWDDDPEEAISMLMDQIRWG
jgi:hypothetical protein